MRVNTARSTDLVGIEDHELNRRWGLRCGPWLWRTKLRILLVIDNRVDLSKDPLSFGLGLVLDTLRDSSFASWVSFAVDVARRQEGRPPIVCEEPGPYEEKYRYFRFTQQGFDLDAYDQVWFFGDWPANKPMPNDRDIDDPQYSPLEDAELKLLVEWMDRGGGVFATGDHDYLGASMCSRIPRVRTMRKWTHAQGVPSQSEDDRNQTMQPLQSTGVPSFPESDMDEVPQPIEPVFRTTGSLLTRTWVPHPLLCAPTGVIDRFPDHMHEGEVIEDDDVELDRPLDIPGYAEPEYPPEVPVVEGASAPQAGPGLSEDEFLRRPRPRVVAHGRTTQPEQSKRFGLVGAYDGEPARIGRVVVDSTWHHWFSFNLDGLRIGNPPVYALMQAYYRNVALWLATRYQRASMLVAATWGALASDPMGFPPGLSTRPWYVGEQAVDVIGRTASQCTLFDLAAAPLGVDAVEAFFVPPDTPESDPCTSCLPAELLVRAMVGGIGARLLSPAFKYHDALVRGRRPHLDPATITRDAVRGIEDAHRALVALARQSPTAPPDLARRLAEGFRPIPPESIPVPVEIERVRIVAERLQLTDPTDPAVIDDHLTFTIRVKAGASIIALEVIERLALPEFGRHGAVVELDRILLEASMQSGERLTLEVLNGSWALPCWAGSESVDPEHVRFTETLGGDPSTWFGAHAPSRHQHWRLWYRLERAEAEGKDGDPRG